MFVSVIILFWCHLVVRVIALPRMSMCRDMYVRSASSLFIMKATPAELLCGLELMTFSHLPWRLCMLLTCLSLRCVYCSARMPILLMFMRVWISVHFDIVLGSSIIEEHLFIFSVASIMFAHVCPPL